MSQTPFKPLKVIGLMSGTSADGIDAALLETDGVTVSSFGADHYEPYSPPLRQRILKAYGKDYHDLDLEQIITERHAEVVSALLKKASLKSSDIDLIGFHGQTLFHQPSTQTGERGKACILGNGPLLATLMGIPVIDQFRLNDLREGGQGAPLVPIFHQALAHDIDKPLAILNIGGVANVTWLSEHESELLGFDTGPGNGLIDDWIRTHTDLLWDEEGKIAAKGRVHETLLNKWLEHPYFLRYPPKSLDRLTFKSCLDDVKSLSLEDGAATLTAFTAGSVVKALNHFPHKPSRWLVVGGGAHNPTLMQMLASRLNAKVEKGTDWGWNCDALEAQAFGYLAVRSLRKLPLTFSGTTGAPYPLSGGRLCKI
jgi:anhydro-N-acetylmuramic acid kinase